MQIHKLFVLWMIGMQQKHRAERGGLRPLLSSVSQLNGRPWRMRVFVPTRLTTITDERFRFPAVLEAVVIIPAFILCLTELAREPHCGVPFHAAASSVVNHQLPQASGSGSGLRYSCPLPTAVATGGSVSR
jgi:hypothetical protein